MKNTKPPKTRKRKETATGSVWERFILSVWGRIVSVILGLGAIAGVFWGLDQHWVNFPFHATVSELTLQKSAAYSKQLAADQALQLQQMAAIIREMQAQQKEEKIDQRIQSAQNQSNFLLRQEMSMREAMARLVAANKPVSPEFKSKLQEVVAEREKAEAEAKRLREAK